MTMDFSAHEMNRLKQSFLLGLAHNPLTETNGLTALSLVAARNRYTRPRPPARASAVPRDRKVGNGRPLLPEAARPILITLLTGKDGKTADPIRLAIAHQIGRSGLGLHPFDYLRLEYFVTEFAQELGAEAHAWLESVRPSIRREHASPDEEPVSEENLAQSGKSQKLSYLKELRSRDPDKARVLIERLLPGEPANVRAELVAVLASSLSDADKSFLASLAADRAQSVRDGASLLLARLPGSDAYQKKLEQVKDRIVAKKAGLLRRRMVFELRADPKSNATFNPLHALNENKELFEGLKLDDIAASFGIAMDDLIAGSIESPDLSHLLLRCALLSKEPVALNLLFPLFTGDISHQMFFLLADLLPRLASAEQAMLLTLAFSPSKWNVLPAASVFAQLYTALGAPLPQKIAVELVESSPWRAAMRNERDDAQARLVEAVAPLVPRALSERFLAEIGTSSRRAVLYHRFLLSLPEPADMRT